MGEMASGLYMREFRDKLKKVIRRQSKNKEAV